MPHYVKSHGLGNDYLVMVHDRLPVELNSARVELICHRNFGVGSDGILLLVPPTTEAEFRVRILNPDGSEAEKSGNGVRIFGKFLWDHGFTKKDRFTLETLGGPVHMSLEVEGDQVRTLTANMGGATFDDFDRITVDGREFSVTSVSVGNPHCVLVVPDVEAIELESIGPKIEHHEAFPNRTNVQFVQVLTRDRVKIIIWERGAGVTLASGSSSSAVVSATYRLGLTERKVTVQSPGGELGIEIDDKGEIWLTGPVEEVCSGDLSPDLIGRLQGLEGPTL